MAKPSVQFFADPVCPWSWITSRWMSDLESAGHVSVRWRTFSIEQRDGGALSPDIPPAFRPAAEAARALSRQVLRVFEATRERAGEQAVGRLYEAFGHRLFLPGRPPAPPAAGILGDALADCALPADLEGAADAAGRDKTITESMAEVFDAAGPKAMSPTMLVDLGDGAAPRVVLGPTLAAVPAKEDAVQVWELLQALADRPEFVEVGRPWPIPTFPAR